MDPREIVTVPCRVVKELKSSWLLAGEIVTRKVKTPRGATFEIPVPSRVPKSKVITIGHGSATMPRWVATQAGLI